MIATVCKNCGTNDGVRYVTFCDGCGHEIEDSESVIVDVPPNAQRHYAQRHFHKKCSPAFEMKCTVCGATAGPGGVTRHDAKLHGDNVPVSKGTH